MATVLSISDTVDIGRTSTYLSLNYVGKKALYGGTVMRPVPPALIPMVTDALDWGVGGETDDSLRITASYLYWLCGKFQLEAQGIIFGPGGGSVVPTPSGGAGTLNVLDFIVSASSIMATGDSSIYFDGSGGRPDFRGMNLNFNRDSVPQYTTNPGDGSLYYLWNKVTGQFQLLGTSAQAAAGERFRIMPDTGTAGSSGSSAASINMIKVTGADFEGDGITLINTFVADATEVILFVDEFTGNWYEEGTFFTKTVDGLVINEAGFDANNFPFILIQKLS